MELHKELHVQLLHLEPHMELQERHMGFHVDSNFNPIWADRQGQIVHDLRY